MLSGSVSLCLGFLGPAIITNILWDLTADCICAHAQTLCHWDDKQPAWKEAVASPWGLCWLTDHLYTPAAEYFPSAQILGQGSAGPVLGHGLHLTRRMQRLCPAVSLKSVGPLRVSKHPQGHMVKVILQICFKSLAFDGFYLLKSKSER